MRLLAIAALVLSAAGLARAVRHALSAQRTLARSGTACDSSVIEQIEMWLEPVMLSCGAVDSSSFHCTADCANAIEMPIHTSEAEQACLDGIMEGHVTSETHGLATELAAFVKSGPHLLQQCGVGGAALAGHADALAKQLTVEQAKSEALQKLAEREAAAAQHDIAATAEAVEAMHKRMQEVEKAKAVVADHIAGTAKVIVRQMEATAHLSAKSAEVLEAKQQIENKAAAAAAATTTVTAPAPAGATA